MAGITVLGVFLSGRHNVAPKFQEVLSTHGCSIKTRIGLHNVADGVCSPSGVILLDVLGSDEEISALEKDILAIEGAQVQKMSFPQA
ncbi:MAG: hypothetical protein WCK67_07720 [bacterium]